MAYLFFINNSHFRKSQALIFENDCYFKKRTFLQQNDDINQLNLKVTYTNLYQLNFLFVVKQMTFFSQSVGNFFS